jgi:hypothetical protein
VEEESLEPAAAVMAESRDQEVALAGSPDPVEEAVGLLDPVAEVAEVADSSRSPPR